ncbi:MAG: cupin domain-containing protein [Chitinophagia bacterium]|jgi:quercetin dioxygenase-like cupin family protein
MKYLFFLLLFSSAKLFGQYNTEISTQTLLKSDTTYSGQKISYPQLPDNETTILKIIIPPGKTTGWHKHPYPVYAVVLQGVLTVEVEGKQPSLLKANEASSEVINTTHRGTNNGKEDVVLIAFYVGGKGKALVIRD